MPLVVPFFSSTIKTSSTAPRSSHILLFILQAEGRKVLGEVFSFSFSFEDLFMYFLYMSVRSARTSAHQKWASDSMINGCETHVVAGN